MIPSVWYYHHRNGTQPVTMKKPKVLGAYMTCPGTYGYGATTAAGVACTGIQKAMTFEERRYCLNMVKKMRRSRSVLLNPIKADASGTIVSLNGMISLKPRRRTFRQ
jgi:hypothetical protein